MTKIKRKIKQIINDSYYEGYNWDTKSYFFKFDKKECIDRLYEYIKSLIEEANMDNNSVPLFHEEIIEPMLSKFEVINAEISYLEQRLNLLAKEARLILRVVSELKERTRKTRRANDEKN